MADGDVLLLLAQLQQRVLQLEDRVRALEDGHHAPAATIDDHRAQERGAILAALNATGWNRAEVSRRLKIPSKTLWRRMREYGLQQGDTRTGITKPERARARARRAAK